MRYLPCLLAAFVPAVALAAGLSPAEQRIVDAIKQRTPAALQSARRS